MKRSLTISASVLLAAMALGSLAFGQAGGDVRRRTIAITYLKDPVSVRLAGTTLRPTARGEATVEGTLCAQGELLASIVDREM